MNVKKLEHGLVFASFQMCQDLNLLQVLSQAGGNPLLPIPPSPAGWPLASYPALDWGPLSVKWWWLCCSQGGWKTSTKAPLFHWFSSLGVSCHKIGCMPQLIIDSTLFSSLVVYKTMVDLKFNGILGLMEMKAFCKLLSVKSWAFSIKRAVAELFFFFS